MDDLSSIIEPVIRFGVLTSIVSISGYYTYREWITSDQHNFKKSKFLWVHNTKNGVQIGLSIPSSIFVTSFIYWLSYIFLPKN